ncbi:MAG: VCBS repeat-containing protein [Gemmatimonadota bacterium]|nr:VCBS repeat-containing protein [Gemmatimonadota bacterium]
MDDWTYIEVDSSRGKWGDWDKPEWLKYFGLDLADVTGDGYKDIVSGRYFYRNPGGDMTGRWQRVDLGINVDGMLFADVDGDKFGDVIAEALPDVYWLEAEDSRGDSWKAVKVCTVPETKHVNGQGYILAQIVAGGKPEILLSAGDGIYCIEIPGNPDAGNWPATRIAAGTSEEGIGAGDIDGDGDIDIAAGTGKGGEARAAAWWVNPGQLKEDWISNPVGPTVYDADRFAVADINGDGRPDIAVAEESGRKFGASVFWFEQSADPGKPGWSRHQVIAQNTTNNMDVADMDSDGDPDIISAEHRGTEKVQIWENLDGGAAWKEHVVSTGLESHLGARVADLDNDGDLDIVSIAWDDYRFCHLWRNDAISNQDKGHKIKKIKWSHLSSRTGDVPAPNVGRQAASLILDIDRDGVDDFVVAGWGDTSMVWFRHTARGWQRYLVDSSPSHIEAGGTYWDIDGDGDLDILQGGSWATIDVWWWENPCPDFNPDTPWKRYTIKNWGEKQHHDQIFGDFDGDGKAELVFWNQRAQKLFIADIPDNPKTTGNWQLKQIWSWPVEFKYEGLAKIDIDLDGKIDLIGGGYWFKHIGGASYTANQIDDYGMSRSAAGDLIEGGRPEVVLGSGDGVGPLNLYEYVGGTWVKHTLIDTVDHGHTLQVEDVNGDGNLDIFCAEMSYWHSGENPDSKTWILYGDGKGYFRIEELKAAEGIGNHESRLGDLDGDGDFDILQKPFEKDIPRVDIWLNN